MVAPVTLHDKTTPPTPDAAKRRALHACGSDPGRTPFISYSTIDASHLGAWHGCPAVEHGLLHLSWPGGKCFPRQLEKDRSNIVWRPIARCGHGQAVPQHAAPHPSCSPSSRRNHAECLACSDTSYVCHGFCVHCTIAPPWKKTVCLAAMTHSQSNEHIGAPSRRDLVQLLSVYCHNVYPYS